ncbi:MAG: TMEM175 family protein [Chloroflexota bacterium]|nr:TMEM175 family protein [Chloroflexota bacterium]
MSNDAFRFNNAASAIEESARASAEEKQTGRIEAFSDGIFAIAATLLVLEVKIPADNITSGAALWSELGGNWSHYLAYLLGFFTILIMWMNHHMLFTYVRRSSHGLLIFNGLLLLVISFVPFPTALMAQYIDHLDTEMARVAMIVYSGVGIVIAIFYNLLWRHMSHNNRLINTTADPREVRAITRGYMFGPMFYLIGFLVAFVSAPASIIANLLLLVFFLLPGRVQGSLADKVARKTSG